MGKKRVSTGIPGLDPLIEGGFPAGRSYLIIGGPGAGKSIFCMQFVLKGLLEGEKAVYVAVDEKPADIVEEAASLGWDLQKFIEERKLVILSASSYVSSRVGAGGAGGVDISKTVSDLSSHVNKAGASRVVIDPMGPLISSHDSAAQEHVRPLVHSLQEHLGTTNLLTSYNSGESAGQREVKEYLVSGVVVLGSVRIGNRLTRTLLVRKMRATAIDLVEHEFSIVKEEGIKLKQDL